jgi:predicted O-linked N-acetylglucosamine transferase (SPINDLY family)
MIREQFNAAKEHQQAGRLAQAEQMCREILLLHPEHPDVLHLLAMIVFQTGRIDESLQLLNRAIAGKPREPAYLVNLGVVLGKAGRFDDAVDALNRALSLRPDLLSARNNLAKTLSQQGKYSESVSAWREYLALRPQDVDAMANLGNDLQTISRFEEALAAYHAVLSARPNDEKMHYNIGLILQAQGKMTDAQASYRRAIAIRPDYAEAQNNLGNVLQSIGELDESLIWYQKSSDLRPQHANALGNVVLLQHYRWGLSPAEILCDLIRWDEIHAAPLRGKILPHENDRNPNRKLRIGYVSGDFTGHVVGRNLLPLFREHDRSHFEIYCYANLAKEDAYTPRFRSHADSWRDILPLTDAQTAELIRADKIDVLVDLAGHTKWNRLQIFAQKPAPVQITFGGYPGGTGLRTMDYHLTDPYLDPPNKTESHYVEKLIRLPHSFWCYDPESMGSADEPVSSLPALANGFVTFGCLNNFCKVTAGTLSLWAKILQSVPRSRMILLCPEGDHRKNVRDRLAVDSTRVDFFANQPHREYLRLYHRIDLGLDTFPYNGHTTSLDSLWMGVPVISWCGETAVSRAGFSQASNLGLADEFIAENEKQFVELAVNWANDLPKLANLRASLRNRLRNSPLTDAIGFARGIESAYRAAWQTWCGNPA